LFDKNFDLLGMLKKIFQVFFIINVNVIFTTSRGISQRDLIQVCVQSQSINHKFFQFLDFNRSSDFKWFDSFVEFARDPARFRLW